MPLIVKNQFTDIGGKVRPLPLPFRGPHSGSIKIRDARTGGPDGVSRCAQVMGGDVGHRGCLARRQRGELRRAWHITGRRVRLESQLARVTHAHVTADPGLARIDGLAGPTVTWLTILEQMQHVLGAQQSPPGEQPVMSVRESPAATNGDQPGVALFREDRHTPSPTIPEAPPRRWHSRGGRITWCIAYSEIASHCRVTDVRKLTAEILNDEPDLAASQLPLPLHERPHLTP